MRKADAAVENYHLGSEDLEGVCTLYLWKRLDICALGEITNLGVDSNLHRKKRTTREI